MVLGYSLVTPCKCRMVGNLLFHFMPDPTDRVTNDAARIHPGMRYLALQEKKLFHLLYVVSNLEGKKSCHVNKHVLFFPKRENSNEVYHVYLLQFPYG